MIASVIEIRVLEPSPGMVLTNGETFSDRVYLGVGDSPDNWWEVPKNDDDVIEMR